MSGHVGTIGLSRFLRNVNTAPPLTVGITDRWGSGKSSMMNLLAEDLARHRGRPVRFNAWHHREEQHLLAALFENIRAQAIPDVFTWPGLVFRVRLFALRTRRLLWWIVASFLFIGIALLIVYLGGEKIESIRVMQQLGGEHALAIKGLLSPEYEWLLGWLAGLGGAGFLVLLVLWVHAKIAPLPSASRLLASLSANARLVDFRDELSFRYRFGEALGEVCGLLRSPRSPGMVLLIDDLDRCSPEDETKVLEAISFCVSTGTCIVVMGMDRRQVEFTVGEGFGDIVKGLPDDELELEPDATAREGEGKDMARQQAFARRYLENS